MAYKIKDWEKFQHFKDRKPPWVKLYRDILDDPDWHELDGDSAKALVSLWLIASEDNTKTGALPDIKTLAFRLRVKESVAIQLLNRLSRFLIQDDINMISERYHVDIPETETETETETDKKGYTNVYPKKAGSSVKKPKAKALEPDLPSWMPVEAWNDYCEYRGRGFTPKAKNLAIAKLERFWNDGHDVEVVLNNSVMNGWRGLFEPKPQSNFQSNQSKKKPNNADIIDIAINAGREYSAAFSTPPQGNHYGQNPTDQNPPPASRVILTDEERAAARAESERLDQEFIDGLNAAYEAESGRA